MLPNGGTELLAADLSGQASQAGRQTVTRPDVGHQAELAGGKLAI